MSGTATAARARLSRTVLRVHRTALIVRGTLVSGPVVWLVWVNEVTVDAVRAVEAECSRGPGICVDLIEALDYSEPTGYVGFLICYSFLAVAAFSGGAPIGRELESGTARPAWTRGVTPARRPAAGPQGVVGAPGPHGGPLGLRRRVRGTRAGDGGVRAVRPRPVSYTHLTLPTN